MLVKVIILLLSFGLLFIDGTLGQETVTCQPRVDVFAYNSVVGGSPRIKAIANVRGTIEILVANYGESNFRLLKTCNPSDENKCDFIQNTAIPYEFGGRDVTYKSILYPATGGSQIEASKVVRIARDDLTLRTFCVDETHIADDGNPNNPGRVCSTPTNGCSVSGKQRKYYSTPLCINQEAATGVFCSADSIEINCSSCTAVGVGTPCDSALLPMPQDPLRIKVPSCTNVAPPSGSVGGSGAPTVQVCCEGSTSKAFIGWPASTVANNLGYFVDISDSQSFAGLWNKRVQSSSQTSIFAPNNFEGAFNYEGRTLSLVPNINYYVRVYYYAAGENPERHSPTNSFQAVSCPSSTVPSCSLVSLPSAGPGTTPTNNLITIPIGRCSSLGFNECEKLTGLYIYNYTTQGQTTFEFTLTLPSDSPGYSESQLDERLISCTNLSDVTIGFYNYTSRSWVPIDSALVNRRLVARINFLGTFTIIKKPSCVPKECGSYGYYLIPPEGFVPINNPLKFIICGFLPGCQPAEPGCSRACPQDIDPQCPVCTKSGGNCCVPKLDDECDTDCAPGIDPDCASSFTPGEINCDDDGTCNPNCPNSTTFKITTTGLLNRNFMWYADVDCCRQYSSQITSNTGDCCKAVCDGTCDGDCIIGQDPDCTYECPYCGDGKLNDVQFPERINAVNPKGYEYESCIECPQDCPGGANPFSYTQTGDGGNAPGEGEENPGGTPGSGPSGQAPGAEEGFGGGFGEMGL